MFRHHRWRLILPLCAALEWGACYNPFGQDIASVERTERDARMAICAFALSVAALIVVGQEEAA